MSRKDIRKFRLELNKLKKEMALETKLFHRSICWEEANMHQERYSLLRGKFDEIHRKMYLALAY